MQQADHLDLLVGNLLDVARLESGDITIQPVETDLRVVLNRAIDQARALTSTHRIECEPLERPIVGVWDAARLEEVMRISCPTRLSMLRARGGSPCGSPRAMTTCAPPCETGSGHSRGGYAEPLQALLPGG